MAATVNSLRAFLRRAVPYRMREWKDKGGPTPGNRAAAVRLLEYYARSSCLLEFHHKGFRVGRCPRLANALARALAALAFQDGGVTMFSQTWNRNTPLPE